MSKQLYELKDGTHLDKAFVIDVTKKMRILNSTVWGFNLLKAFVNTGTIKPHSIEATIAGLFGWSNGHRIIANVMSILTQSLEVKGPYETSYKIISPLREGKVEFGFPDSLVELADGSQLKRILFETTMFKIRILFNSQIGKECFDFLLKGETPVAENEQFLAMLKCFDMIGFAPGDKLIVQPIIMKLIEICYDQQSDSLKDPIKK